MAMKRKPQGPQQPWWALLMRWLRSLMSSSSEMPISTMFVKTACIFVLVLVRILVAPIEVAPEKWSS